jgi:hypothetical protein
MNIKPTKTNFILPAGIYVGLKSSTHLKPITANKQQLEVLRDHFGGLNATLLKQMPWVLPKLPDLIKPVGRVKVPSTLLGVSLIRICADDPVILVNKNDYIGKIPSTFSGLQIVMGKCFSTSQNLPVISRAGDLTGEIGKKYVEMKGVFAWLDRFTDKPNGLSVCFMLNLMRHSPADILEMALPLKGIEIVDDFSTKGISLEDITQDPAD